MVLENSVTEISAGVYDNLVLDCNGNVWSFGGNSCGQLGVGLQSRSFTTPQQILGLSPIRKIWCGGASSFVMDFDDKMFVFGANTFAELGFINDGQEDQILTPIENELLQNIETVIPGTSHTFFVSETAVFKVVVQMNRANLGLVLFLVVQN